MTNTGAFVCCNIFPGMSSKLTTAQWRKKNLVLLVCHWCPGWEQPGRTGCVCLLPAATLPSGTQPGFHSSRDTGPNLSGVEVPQSWTSKFSEHRPVFFAQALIKSFQSKMGFSISSEDLQHNADKSHRGQPGHGQISLWTAQRTGAKPADQPKFHDQLYNNKHQKGNKRFIWKKPSGDIGSHCAFYKERTISECRAWSKSPGRQPWAQIQEHT